MGPPKIQKSKINYRTWLVLYKGKDIDKITLEEHTKFSKMYAAWKVGNIEKVWIIPLHYLKAYSITKLKSV